MTEENTDKTRLISIPQAAEIYGFHPEYLSKLAKKGRLKAHKIGKMWVTTQIDMEDFIRSRTKKGAYRDDIQVD